MKGVRNYLRAVRKGLRTPCFLQVILDRFISRTFISFAPYMTNSLGLISLIISNISIFITPDGSLPRLFGAILLLLLPGLVWAHRLTLSPSRGWRILLGIGLSYTLMTLAGLALHYLPGPIYTWQIMLTFNLLTLSALPKWHVITRNNETTFFASLRRFSPSSRSFFALFAFILLWGALFRLTRLGYSEFQIDEVKAMTAAAQAIEGQPDALFFPRKKGPVEVILPMLLWPLMGTINEATARSLFALAGFAIILTTYFLTHDLSLYNVSNVIKAHYVALLSASFITLNGFMIGFGRVVQYQVIVVLMCLLVLATAWQWYQTGRFYWLAFSGTFYAIGLLSHYDALLVGAPLAYLILARPNSLKVRFQATMLTAAMFISVSSFFFLPYLLDPQITSTGNYLTSRIGGGEGVIKNRLDSFFDVTITFNSFYYFLIIGLLLLIFIAWTWHQLHPRLRYIGTLFVSLSTLALFLRPDLLTFNQFDGAALLFTVIFSGAILSPPLDIGTRALLIWLAVTFLGYNFIVADPRTHIYIIFPSWLMLISNIHQVTSSHLMNKPPIRLFALFAFIFAFFAFSGYLYLVYLRPYPEFTRDWPLSKVSFYWSPYSRPGADFGFGFVHRVGWKAIGGLYLTEQLSGDYQTNDKYEIADWYTHYQLRGCYHSASQFFQLANSPIDPIAFAAYMPIGTLQYSPEVNRLILHQRQPTTLHLGDMPLNYLTDIFDQQAYPTRFIPPTVESHQTNFNLAGAIRLIGYDLTRPQLVAGQPIAITLYWQSQQYTPLNLESWVELQSATGQRYALSQNQPDCGDQPTSVWHEGDRIDDLHLITPATLPPGYYRLMTGLYLPEQKLRLPLVDEAGNSLPDGIKLKEFDITD